MDIRSALPRPGGRSRLRRSICHHPVVAFLVMVYAVSWTLFLPSLLSRSGIGLLPFDIPPQPFLILSSLLGLTLPAYLVTRVADGRAGTRQLRCRYLRWRVGGHWYLLAILGPLAASVLGAAIWLGTDLPSEVAEHWRLVYSAYLPQVLLIALLVNLWEEGGWTGFLLPRLQARWGPLRGGALVAVCQGLVHLPLLFIVGGVSDERIAAGDYWKYLVFLVVLSQPVRVLMVWLWNGTRGSLPIVGFFHAAVNVTTSAAVVPKLVPGRDSVWVYGVYAGLAVVVIVATRGRLGYLPNRSM